MALYLLNQIELADTSLRCFKDLDNLDNHKHNAYINAFFIKPVQTLQVSGRLTFLWKIEVQH